jgi:hypothetical protein
VREAYQDIESRKEDAKEAAVDSVRRLEETWQLFRELEPKLIVNDEQIFRELKDRFGSCGGGDQHGHTSQLAEADKVYSVDAAGPAPCSIKAPARLTTAVGDMQTAYTDAAGRSATITELGAGNIGGLTLGPGVYSWSSNVTIPTNLALKGGLNAVWIFQISKNLNVSSGKAVLLRGHARAQNVFWQVAGKVVLGTTSHFEGTVLSKTLIAMRTGASINGRLFAQTAVTLQMNSVVVH